MGEGRRDNAYGARRLGFGVSGPHGTPMIRPETTVRMVQHAYALGVRIFDTGPSYGAGEAERRLGEALARLPPYDPIVMTKAGIQSSGLTKRHRDFSPTGIRRSVEGSLKRLRRERIDWLFLHGPSPGEMTDELLKVLTDMRRRGDVVSIGVCGRGAARAISPARSAIPAIAVMRAGEKPSEGALTASMAADKASPCSHPTYSRAPTSPTRSCA